MSYFTKHKLFFRFLFSIIIINLIVINKSFNSLLSNPQKVKDPVSEVSIEDNLQKGFDDSPVKLRKINSKIPSEFNLFQNYPNPFNPSTKIRFNIPTSNDNSLQSVTLTVYNIIRQKVATLLNDQLEAGHYEIEWNATGFNSGVYFYQLATDENTKVMRMILVK